MTITNIVDRRRRTYRFMKINAIVEAAWHDNSCKDCDHAPNRLNEGPHYEEREHVTLAEAVKWANSFPTDVTLYLYDENGGIYEAELTHEEGKRS